MFARWGSLVARRRIVVLLLAIGLALAGAVWGSGVFDRLSQGGYEPENAESTEAAEILEDKGLSSRADVVLIYEPSEGKLDDRATAEDIVDKLDGLDDDAVSKVSSYWHVLESAKFHPEPVKDVLDTFSDDDGKRALAVLTLDGTTDQERLDSYEKVSDQLEVEGTDVEVGGFIPLGQSMNERATSDLIVAESIAIPITLILLVLIFGTLTSAFLPVIIGGLAVGGSTALLRAISSFTEVSAFAMNMSMLLGLGMAIDYGLFIVSRFREELANGHDPATAIRRTVATAGKTVAVSGTLLIVALAGMLIFPQPFIRSLGMGGMAAVFIAMLLSLTALPAILSLLGHRVNALAVPWRRKQLNSDGRSATYDRLARWVMKRPVLIAVPILAGLLLVATPVGQAAFGQFGEKSLPRGDDTREVVRTLNADFAEASNDGAMIVLRGDDNAPSKKDSQEFAADVADVDNVSSVNEEGRKDDVVLLRAAFDVQPDSPEADQIVHDIRGLDPPKDAELLVGGTTAQGVDTKEATLDTLPIMFAIMISVTLVFLFFAFGSLLLPLKAVLMSALSMGASLGILVLVFQEGYGADLLGVDPHNMDIGVLVIIIALLFGLSTDYEVFLVSRMVEAKRAGASNVDAVAAALSRTGRIITAAAVLLMVVIGAFGLSAIPMMRVLAIGMAVALLIDATLIRMLLVPALVKLLGEANWWLPKPLRPVAEKFAFSEEVPDEPSSKRDKELVDA